MADAEDYVRPPVVALEPVDPRVAIWRFRIVLLAILIVLAVVIFLIARSVVSSGEGSPAVLGPLGHHAADTITHHLGARAA